MKSLKDSLHDLIKEKGYITYSEIIDFALAEGYRPSNAERRMRELVNEFPIEAIEKKGKRGSMYIAAYQWIILSPRKEVNKILPLENIEMWSSFPAKINNKQNRLL